METINTAKHVMDNFRVEFDIGEAKKSNILISGTNSTGKSRLAAGIASILQEQGWRIIVFDNCGVWRKISNVPTYTLVTALNVLGKVYPMFNESIIYDIPLLTPDMQKQFVDQVLRDLWDSRVNSDSEQWILVVLEEFELYGRNTRGSTAQNLFRMMHAGRNLKIRVLRITTDLALIDASFIRLCQQRYHARLSIEENSKRKFRAYYGGDWTRIATEGLDLGYFIYLLRDKLKLIHVPLFQTTRKPERYQPPKKPSTWEKIKNFFKASEAQLSLWQRIKGIFSLKSHELIERERLK